MIELSNLHILLTVKDECTSTNWEMDHPLVRPQKHLERGKGPCFVVVVVVDYTTGRH